MSSLPEITDLLARLASNLDNLDPMGIEGGEEQAFDISISKLNRSLNLSEDSRVRVLDTALSLMCFKAPQVYDSVIEHSVKTIVSVLSSSVSCKVFRFQKEEVLHVGSSISRLDCGEMIKACVDISGKLERNGMPSHLLSYAVVRMAALASCHQCLFPLIHILEGNSSDQSRTTVSKIFSHFPRELSVKSDEIPLRLLLWYLDPLTLKHEVTQILQETVKRPFLHFSREFHERMNWRTIIVCLALSPTMFIETRALLHNWFLMTGLVSVLELLIELVSLIMDVVSRPTWWGISVEIGSKLPISNAYFPCMHHLLRIFIGPLSSESFLHLVQLISGSVSHSGKHLDPIIKQAAMKVGKIHHKSNWAMALNFPDWFFFASVLLFLNDSFQDSFTSKCMLSEPKSENVYDVGLPSLSAAAARYIAWILSPFSESDQDFLVNCFTEISGSWALEQFGSDSHSKETAIYWKKLKKPKFHFCKDQALPKDDDCQTIELWLKEFQNMYMKHWNKTVNFSASYEATYGFSRQCNVLFRRIPLGLLISGAHHLDEDGCEILLHYAATGTILHSGKTLKHTKEAYEETENLIPSTEGRALKEAIAGACIVFNLTDVAENMSTSLFESEDCGLDFLCHLKAKVGRYLLKCLKKLLQLSIDKNDAVPILIDLQSRLVHWRFQGRAVFHGDKNLEDGINNLAHKLSSF